MNGRRLAGARVSGWAKAKRARLTTEANRSAAKIPRQPVMTKSADPASGASIGETENTRKIFDIMRVACAPVNMSRTMARGTTPKAAPPSPCTKRPAIRPVAVWAVMHRMVPKTNIAIPA